MLLGVGGRGVGVELWVCNPGDALGDTVGAGLLGVGEGDKGSVCKAEMLRVEQGDGDEDPLSVD